MCLGIDSLHIILFVSYFHEHVPFVEHFLIYGIINNDNIQPNVYKEIGPSKCTLAWVCLSNFEIYYGISYI